MFFCEVGLHQPISHHERFPWNHCDHLLMDFSKKLLYMESLQIIDKFCSGPLANFLNVVYIFMQVIWNAKQPFADVLKK